MGALHDSDFNAWLEEQIRLIKDKKFEKLDIENLLEEMEDLGVSQRNAIESYLMGIILHMLKQEYQPTHAGKSWSDSIVNARAQIRRIIKKNPSLKKYPEKVLNECYEDAIRAVFRETGIDKSRISTICKWSLREILGE